MWFKDKNAVIQELQRVEELSNESSESSYTSTVRSSESGVPGSLNVMPSTGRAQVDETPTKNKIAPLDTFKLQLKETRQDSTPQISPIKSLTTFQS